MISFLIGHRGVGKSTLLARIQQYAAEAGTGFQGYDLDREVERSRGQSIEQIFAASGESGFRRLEGETLALLLTKLDQQTPAWIALGAGFKGQLPEGSRKIWLRRPTDAIGRVFLDRPRLESDMSPFDEYHSRFSARESHYREIADLEVTIPEGFTAPSGWEAALFGFKPAQSGGTITLLPERFRSVDGLNAFILRHRNLGIGAFELRDDLLSFEKLQLARKILEPGEVIYSFRTSNRRPSQWSEAKTDWALELGKPTDVSPDILSLHNREEDFDTTLRKFPSTDGVILKLAVEVHNFSELALGHRWWKENPKGRAFLPRSSDGRWSWYRQLFSRQMPLAFIREGDGSAADQPLLADWMRTPAVWKSFAAILGYPVVQSFTPAEHGEFFAKQGMPVVAIPIMDDEWTGETLKVLTEFSLKAAAVTAPLKIKTCDLMQDLTEVARSFKSVNTIVSYSVGWQGHNTDADGFEALLPSEITSMSHGDVAVWGGGGTRELIKCRLPNAAVFAARGGISDRGNLAMDFNPEVVVWAVGRVRMHALQWPPSQWKPKLIIDLNYSDDSPGREYALRVGADYRGGLPMFKAQASAQREFWRPHFSEVIG